MKNVKTQMKYYEANDSLLLAKVGEAEAYNDIFYFDREKKEWVRLTVNDNGWSRCETQILREAVELPKEILKRENIPLIENVPEDETQQFFEKYGG